MNQKLAGKPGAVQSICLQTAALGVSVAQVARRYAVNANLIFKWLRDARFAPFPSSAMGIVPALKTARGGSADLNDRDE